MSTSDAPESQPPVAAPEIAPPPAQAVAKPARKGGSGLGALLLGLVGGIAGALAVSFVPVKIPGTATARMASAIDQAGLPQLAQRVAALEQRFGGGADASALSARLQSAEKDIAALHAQLSGLPAQGNATMGADDLKALAGGLSTSVAEMKGRVDALTVDVEQAKNLAARIGTLETRVPADLGAELQALAAKGDVEAINARVAKLEANTSAYDAKRAAAAIALANLARTAESGGTFSAELNAVRLLNVDTGLVDPLTPFADKGVRPAPELAADFAPAAREAIRADRRAAPNWWTRLWASVTSLLVIRSEDARAGSSVDAVLSRAGAAARTGNLQTAVTEISHLRGPAADAMSSWRAQAQARVALDQLVTKLSAQILADLRN